MTPVNVTNINGQKHKICANLFYKFMSVNLNNIILKSSVAWIKIHFIKDKGAFILFIGELLQEFLVFDPKIIENIQLN